MSTPAAYGLAAMKFLWEEHGPSTWLTPVPEEAWLDEFFFCLLGGYGIPFELNQSAFDVLHSKGYFLPENYFGDYADRLRNKLELELKSRQFTPLRKDGTFRSFRFPQRKAKILVEAGQWLLRMCEFHLSSLLVSEPKQDRRILLECPGFGYKTASWFLRNIGQGNGLAILDTHVYQTLRDFAIIPSTLTVESDYLEIEAIFCDACDIIGARADVMDLIVWTWARGGASDQRCCRSSV